MKIISYFIDSLFPPRESELLVRALSEEKIEALYKPQHLHDCLSLSRYSDSYISALITENKFYQNTTATKALAQLLAYWLKEQFGPVVLVPIPLSASRQRERGYNQVQQVLQTVHHDRHTIRTDLLQRIKDTKPQVSLHKADRLLNTKGAFIADSKVVSSLRDTTIILIDDVYTTGATMRAASEALRTELHSSCTLFCLTLAH